MPDNLADSNNAAPVPINPAAAVMGVPPPPNISQAPLASRNAPAYPNQPANPDEQHSALGRGLLHIAHAIEGKQVDYVPQSDGSVQPIVSQRKPGGLFRDMVLGAIAGNVAASTTPTKPGSGGLSGFGIGAQAGINQQAQQQQQRQQQAQQQAKQKQQLSQDNIAAATVAADTASSVNIGHFIGHHDQKEIGALNNSVGIIKDQALSAGGQLAQIPGIENGKPGNGPALMAAINRDPSLMQGPADYHRIPLVTYGTDGMSHDGKAWNSDDGNDVNWNDRATVTLVDLPNAAWNKQVTMTKADVNRIAGYPIVKGKDTDSVQTTFGSLFSLGLQSKKQLADTRTERLRGPKDENEALQWKSSLQGIDPQSSDYALAKSRADKADSFLEAQSDQKNAGKGAPAPPKTLAEAAVSLAGAKFADGQSSTADTKKALAQAQSVYDGVVNAKKDELQAEYKTQLKLARGKADAERTAKEQYDRNLYGVLTSGDQTGWTPKSNQFMTETQFNSAKEKFADSVLSKAEDTDKSYNMFQNAYGEYKAAKGKLPTGAQSMLALSTHLSTTFGNVKGSRVTKDMIQEHLGARSVSDDALVAIQKLTGGDVLSPKQWNAFSDLISQSRNQTWKNAADNAHYRGLPADFLPEDLSGTQQNRSVPVGGKSPNAPPRQNQQGGWGAQFGGVQR